MLRWSRLKGQQWAASTLPMEHDGHYYNTQLKVTIEKKKPGSQHDAGAYVASVASIKPGSQYDAGAYVASVASSLVHNMTLELT